MNNLSFRMVTANALRKLIKKYYPSQEKFAEDYCMDIRNISRYVNNGIGKLDMVEEIANFFHLTWEEFLEIGKED